MIGGLRTRAVVPLAVLGAVGCSSAEPGEARAGATGPTSTERPSETTTAVGDPLADFDSCEVLNSVAAQLNLTEVEADGQACGAEFSATASVSIKAEPDLAIGEAVGRTVSDISVGPRKGKLAEAPASSSSCLVAVEVTPTSRVDVAASADASLQEACDAATKVATAIEPKLPR